MKKSFQAGGKPVTLFTEGNASLPIIYINTFGHEGEALWSACQSADCPPFSLVIIGDVDWNDEMSPWPAPPISAMDSACTGGADDYLNVLTKDILPAAEAALPADPTWRALGGYSLAGLFAVYAPFRTAAFDRILSASGSLWYPDFTDYVAGHSMLRKPDCVYLSLGDREARTRNKTLQPVQERSEWLCQYYQSAGIPSVFELNPGNHYRNAARRMSKGVRWILEQP